MVARPTQYKGGVGKTTSAICLATLLSNQAKTLLIDSGPNRSPYPMGEAETAAFR